MTLLAALALAGAAGVYFATQDPGEKKVEDLGSQAADGSGGGDVITYREQCSLLRTKQIPGAQTAVDAAEQALTDYLNLPVENAGKNPNWCAENYMLQTFGWTDKKKLRQSALRYITHGEPLDEDTGYKKPLPWLVSAMNAAKKQVEAHRTNIDSYQKALDALKAKELELTADLAC